MLGFKLGFVAGNLRYEPSAMPSSGGQNPEIKKATPNVSKPFWIGHGPGLYLTSPLAPFPPVHPAQLFAAPAWDLKALAKPSASPRRTSVMRFTCEACGTLNYHFVNPLAFGKGTIFATCSQPDCGVTHTVVDNLDLVWTGEEASAEGSSDSGSA
jgi:hypothetical protein